MCKLLYKVSNINQKAEEEKTEGRIVYFLFVDSKSNLCRDVVFVEDI